MIDIDLEHDVYCVMMFCFGAVVRKGDRKQKAALLLVLRRNRAAIEDPDSPRPQN